MKYSRSRRDLILIMLITVGISIWIGKRQGEDAAKEAEVIGVKEIQSKIGFLLQKSSKLNLSKPDKILWEKLVRRCSVTQRGFHDEYTPYQVPDVEKGIFQNRVLDVNIMSTESNAWYQYVLGTATILSNTNGNEVVFDPKFLLYIQDHTLRSKGENFYLVCHNFLTDETFEWDNGSHRWMKTEKVLPGLALEETEGWLDQNRL